jgi:hypothetical protein
VDDQGHLIGQGIQIANGEADISLSKSVLDEKRARFFTFLQPYYVTKYAVIIKIYLFTCIYFH